MIRTLIVDDDDIVREALGILLGRRDDLKIVESVATGEEALVAARRLRPDLILLDFGLPGLSGMDTLRSIIESLGPVRIVVLSANQSAVQIRLAFDAGAAGYVFKSSAGLDLLDAIHAVMAGHPYTSPAAPQVAAEPCNSTGARGGDDHSPGSPVRSCNASWG